MDGYTKDIGGQSYKHSMIVNYDSTDQYYKTIFVFIELP